MEWHKRSIGSVSSSSNGPITRTNRLMCGSSGLVSSQLSLLADPWVHFGPIAALAGGHIIDSAHSGANGGDFHPFTIMEIFYF